MKSPRFVSAKLARDGKVEMTTDEGDVYYVEMHRDSPNGWPILSRLMRWRDQFDYGIRRKPEAPPTTKPPPAGPPRLKAV